MGEEQLAAQIYNDFIAQHPKFNSHEKRQDFLKGQWKIEDMDPENSIKRDLIQRQLEVMDKLDPVKIGGQEQKEADFGGFDKPAIPSAISPEQQHKAEEVPQQH